MASSELTWARRRRIRPYRSPGWGPRRSSAITLGLCARATTKGTAANPLNGGALTLG
jgi:hypothetical protein